MNLTFMISLQWGVLLIQGALLLVLYRQVGLTFLARSEAISRDGPKRTQLLPASLKEAVGAGLAHADPWTKAVVIFARSGCKVCSTVWPELRRFKTLPVGRDVAVAIVFEGSDADADAYRRNHGLDDFPFIKDTSGRLSRIGKVRVTPFAISVDEEWKVFRKGLVNNVEHLQLLAGRAPIDMAETQERAVVDRRSNAVELA